MLRFVQPNCEISVSHYYQSISLHIHNDFNCQYCKLVHMNNQIISNYMVIYQHTHNNKKTTLYVVTGHYFNNKFHINDVTIKYITNKTAYVKARYVLNSINKILFSMHSNSKGRFPYECNIRFNCKYNLQYIRHILVLLYSKTALRYSQYTSHTYGVKYS